MYFFEYQHMCASTNVLLIVYNSAEQHGVSNESVLKQIEWASDLPFHSDGLTCLVSNWISCFEWIVWFELFNKYFF